MLESFGGYYSDIDTVKLKNIDDWTKGMQNKVGFIAGIEVDTNRQDWKDWYPRSLQFCQWTMASSPQNRVIKKVVDLVLENLNKVNTTNIKEGFVVHLTGPAPFSDAITTTLEIQNVKLEQLRNMQEPILFGDILTLPITGFSPGVGHMGSKSIHDKQALVRHRFNGEWKTDQ